MLTATLLALLASPLVALMVLTGLGATRRGSGWATALVAGVMFPITWTVWYVRDEHPSRRAQT